MAREEPAFATPFMRLRRTFDSRGDELPRVMRLDKHLLHETYPRHALANFAGHYYISEDDYPLGTPIPAGTDAAKDFPRQYMYFDDGKTIRRFELSPEVNEYLDDYAQKISNDHRATQVFLKMFFWQNLVAVYLNEYLYSSCFAYPVRCECGHVQPNLFVGVEVDNVAIYFEKMGDSIVVHHVVLHGNGRIAYDFREFSENPIEHTHPDVVQHNRFYLTAQGSFLHVRIVQDTLLYQSCDGDIKPFALHLLLNHQDDRFKQVFGGRMGNPVDELPLFIKQRFLASSASMQVTEGSVVNYHDQNAPFNKISFHFSCPSFNLHAREYAMQLFALRHVWRELVRGQAGGVVTLLYAQTLACLNTYNLSGALDGLEEQEKLAFKTLFECLPKHYGRDAARQRVLINAHAIISALHDYVSTECHVVRGDLFEAATMPLSVSKGMPLAKLLDHLINIPEVANAFFDIRGAKMPYCYFPERGEPYLVEQRKHTLQVFQVTLSGILAFYDKIVAMQLKEVVLAELVVPPTPDLVM